MGAPEVETGSRPEKILRIGRGLGGLRLVVEGAWEHVFPGVWWLEGGWWSKERGRAMAVVPGDRSFLFFVVYPGGRIVQIPKRASAPGRNACLLVRPVWNPVMTQAIRMRFLAIVEAAPWATPEYARTKH
jgi:hypothetical protein